MSRMFIKFINIINISVWHVGQGPDIQMPG